jgi:hypothetical protein
MNDQEALETQKTASTIDLDELENRLQAQLSGRVRDLQVRLHDCGIVLRGFARTYHAKQIAQHAIMVETNVPILANEIEVY